MRNFILAFAVALALMFGSAALISAAPNPSGTGQPGAECGAPGAEVMPAGFNTDGFAHVGCVRRIDPAVEPWLRASRNVYR